MKPHKNYTLTVTMTGRPPIRIRTEDWPVISYAGNERNQWIVTRRCRNTGTTIVSAVNQNSEPERRAGFIVDPQVDPVPAIRDAADEAGIGPELVQDAIAELPAEDLSGPPVDWGTFFDDMDFVADGIVEDFPDRAGIVREWLRRIQKAVKL